MKFIFSVILTSKVQKYTSLCLLPRPGVCSVPSGYKALLCAGESRSERPCPLHCRAAEQKTRWIQAVRRHDRQQSYCYYGVVTIQPQ